MVIWSFGNNPVLIIENDQKYFKKKKKNFLLFSKHVFLNLAQPKEKNVI